MDIKHEIVNNNDKLTPLNQQIQTNEHQNDVHFDLNNNGIIPNKDENEHDVRFKDVNESDAASSRDDGRVSCLGRVTWLGGGETEVGTEHEEEGDDDEDEEDDEDEVDNGNDDDDDGSSSTETIVRQQSRWGWFVVFGSMVIHMIADGISFSFGVLLYSLIDTFHVTKSDVALVGSILGGLPLFFGPVCSYLVNRFSCRAVTITGGIITALGFLLSSFVQSFNWFYLTMSIISGVGLSLVYVPAVVIVAYYFEEKRSLATGLAVSGTGIGYALFAPLIDIMIEKLKWRNTLRVLACCFLLISACGILFKPIEYKVEKKEKEKKPKGEVSEEAARLKEKKRKKKKRSVKINDSRLPSRMSSTEKLELFIKRMEEAENEHAEELEEMIEMQDLEKSNKVNKDVTTEQRVTNENIDIGVKRLVKSYSIAALPSFYLSFEFDKDQNKDDKISKPQQSIGNAQSIDLKNDDKALKTFPEHDQLKQALQKQLGLHPQNQQLSKFQKHHTEAANLCSIPEHTPFFATNKPVITQANSSSKSSIQTLFDQESLKQLELDDSKNRPILSVPETQQATGTKRQPKKQVKSGVERRQIYKKPNLTENQQLGQQLSNKQDLLRAYNLPLCRKDIFYRGSVINLRRMLLKQLPEKLNYNKNTSNVNILYSQNPSIYGQAASLTFSCPNLYLRYPYGGPSESSESSSSSSSSSTSSLSSTLSSSSISSLLDDENNETEFKRRRRKLCSAKHSSNKCVGASLRLLKRFFSLSIIKNPLFLLFGFSNFIFYMWHEIPMMFIRDYTDECKCMKNYEIWILFISCGLANAVGQWIYGYLGDREKINEKILYAVSTIICGVTVLTIPFVLNSLALMITDQILFGIFLSANYVLNSIILVEILGVDKLTDAYGMLLLLQGFALVIGSPLAGWIGDVTKDYNNTFYFSGAFIIVSGVMLLFLPLVEKLYKKHRLRKKRLKLQKRKRKILTSKILNNPFYNSNNGESSKHNVLMTTITEVEEQKPQPIEEEEEVEKIEDNKRNHVKINGELKHKI